MGKYTRLSSSTCKYLIGMGDERDTEVSRSLEGLAAAVVSVVAAAVASTATAIVAAVAAAIVTAAVPTTISAATAADQDDEKDDPQAGIPTALVIVEHVCHLTSRYPMQEIS